MVKFRERPVIIEGIKYTGDNYPKVCEFTGCQYPYNKLQNQDKAAHDWYRFVLSYPPHLVRHYVQSFGLDGTAIVLDPFCGTGTTLVECKKMGIPSVGIEAHPMTHFASQVKVDWSVNADQLRKHAEFIAGRAQEILEAEGIIDDHEFFLFEETAKENTGDRCLDPEVAKLLLTDSISPLPLHKCLILLEVLEKFRDAKLLRHEKLAFAKALVFSISNPNFGPEVGVGPIKEDAPVLRPWLSEIDNMADDLRLLKRQNNISAVVHHADSRELLKVLKVESVDAVITSPPYPNEKDYTRTTRLESVLLGFIHNKKDLQKIKRNLVRSNTRGVYKEDDDDQWSASFPEIQRIADEIEKRRIELGKTSGFERLYARVTKLYFGGMAKHLADLRKVLRPGAKLAYVVGDQKSYLRIMIRTGQLLAEIAQSLGYELTGIDLFRTRLATATKEQMREEVVVLRWPGSKHK